MEKIYDFFRALAVFERKREKRRSEDLDYFLKN
ncbi:MAG: hypothetical protein ACI9TO_000977, partial [Rickettsiales bacterium]